MTKWTSCKDCKHISRKYDFVVGYKFMIGFSCNHPSCFSVMKFDPYTGTIVEERIMDYGNNELNQCGYCPEYEKETENGT